MAIPLRSASAFGRQFTNVYDHACLRDGVAAV
jgi:hypothetical protein